jgi:hypothetical protein
VIYYEVGSACGIHGREEKCIQRFDRKAWWEGISWKTYVRWDGDIKMVLREMGWATMDLKHLSSARDEW